MPWKRGCLTGAVATETGQLLKQHGRGGEEGTYPGLCLSFYPLTVCQCFPLAKSNFRPRGRLAWWYRPRCSLSRNRAGQSRGEWVQRGEWRLTRMRSPQLFHITGGAQGDRCLLNCKLTVFGSDEKCRSFLAMPPFPGRAWAFDGYVFCRWKFLAEHLCPGFATIPWEPSVFLQKPRLFELSVCGTAATLEESFRAVCQLTPTVPRAHAFLFHFVGAHPAVDSLERLHEKLIS